MSEAEAYYYTIKDKFPAIRDELLRKEIFKANNNHRYDLAQELQSYIKNKYTLDRRTKNRIAGE